MKKTLAIICIAALAFAACKKEESFPVPEAGVKYVFEGTVATDGFTWSTSSIIGLYSLTEGVKVSNEQCKIDGWANVNAIDEETGEPVPYTPSPYDGKATGKFTSPEMDLIAGPNKFLVYTPYDENLSYIPSLGMIYDLSVSENQTQPAPGIAGGCFALATCEGIPVQDDKFSFSLNPVTALLKISVSSSEFADYGIKKITVKDPAGKAALGGKFDVNVNTMEFTTASTFSKVATTVTAPSSIGSGAQSVYVNILPGDYSATDFEVIVELTGAKGNATIPMTVKGGKYDAGTTSEIKIEGLKSADNKYAWYCPVEPRHLTALGYAYGDANTYLIQCKSGKTYTGATYAENADIPSKVEIDFRARGDFNNAIDPTGATFEWFIVENSTVNGGQPFGTVSKAFKNLGIETTSVNTVVIDDSKIKFTVDAANYKVTVENVGLFASAPMLVMKKDGKILWAWTFWNVAADGTKLEAVQLGNYKIANMDIGQATTNFAAWVIADNPAWSTTYRYQWGRFAPATVFTTGYWNLTAGECTNGTIPGHLGQMTFAESIADPIAMVVGEERGVDAINWTSDYYGDLWGGNVKGDIEATGTKSIYDPCPKGWRVADPSALTAISETAATQVTTNGLQGFTVGGLTLLSSGYVNSKADASKTTEYRLATMGGAYTSANYAALWSNYIGAHQSNQPKALNFGNGVTGGTVNAKIRIASFNRTLAAPVRCQKDDDNR